MRILQALSLASGKELTHEGVIMRARVLYVTLEDNLDELRKRFRAARNFHKITDDQVKGFLYLWAPNGFKLAVQMQSRQIVAGQLAQQLRSAIKDKQIDLVIIDPFVKAYGGDIEENSNSAIDAVCGILIDLLQDLNIAIDLLHHERKGDSEAGDANRARGASALVNAARLVKTLTQMSAKEAELYGIADDQRHLYVRYDDAKVNIAPRAAAKWYQLHNVEVGNPTRDRPNGDTRQAIERWHPPVIIGLTPDDLLHILHQIDGGMDNGQRYTDYWQNIIDETTKKPKYQPRAAMNVIQAHHPDWPAKKCQALIRHWVKKGVLYSRPYPDPIQGKDIKGLYADITKLDQQTGDA
jgi:hypothetical protein